MVLSWAPWSSACPWLGQDGGPWFTLFCPNRDRGSPSLWTVALAAESQVTRPHETGVFIPVLSAPVSWGGGGQPRRPGELRYPVVQLRSGGYSPLPSALARRSPSWPPGFQPGWLPTRLYRRQI